MLTTLRNLGARQRRFLLFFATITLSIWVIFLVARYPDRILAGDPAEYRERVAAIIEGGLPYMEVPFEHLPVMVAPMVGAWFLGGAESQSIYVVSFAALMALTMASLAVVVDVAGEALSASGHGWRWAAVTAPMLPLILFRNDPVSVLLAIVALLFLIHGRPSWWLWASAGAFAKIWPAALAALGWRRHRLGSFGVAVAGALALGISFLPGFVNQRNALGIHAETVMGALVGLWRTASGRSPDVTVTTAAYIDVAIWVPIVNALIGLAVLSFGLAAVLRADEARIRVVGLGAVVTGVILTSSLFSLQYVLWTMPFLILSRRKSAFSLALTLAVWTLVLAWLWSPPRLESPLFYALISGRNALVVLSAILMARERSLPLTF